MGSENCGGAVMVGVEPGNESEEVLLLKEVRLGVKERRGEELVRSPAEWMPWFWSSLPPIGAWTGAKGELLRLATILLSSRFSSTEWERER